MKIFGRRVLAFTILALALLMIISGGMGYLLISHEPKTDHLLLETQKELVKNKERRQEKINKAEYGGEVTHVEGAAIAEARKNYSSSIEEYGIGSVYIPTAKISLPLLAGTSEWNLLNGVATASADQKLGEGLFIGMSHNLINQRLLQNIDQVEKEDFVYLTDFNEVFTYKVSEQGVVHETESYYLRDPGRDASAKLLLYRCEGGVNTEWRRIIYGNYIKKEKIGEVDEEILEGLMINLEEGNTIEKIESESIGSDEISAQKERGSKNVFEHAMIKVLDSIGQIDFLSHLFLKSYGFADSYPLLFILLVIFLLIIYYLV